MGQGAVVRAVRRGPVQDRSRWPPRRSRGGLLGLGLAAALVGLGLLLLNLALRQSVGPLMLIGLLLAALVVGAGAATLVAALGYFRLAYLFGPDRLVIRSAVAPETVLYDEIDGIYAGQRVGHLRQVRGLSWPGYHLGLIRSRTLGVLRVFCTDRRPDALSVIVTPDRTLVLTPADPSEFRRELIRRIEAAPGGRRTDNGPEAARWPPWPRPLTAALLAASAALLLAGLAALLAAYDTLPPMVPLLLDLLGRPAGLSPRADLFNLTALGLGVLAANLAVTLALRGRERAAAILLGTTTALVQTVILLATLRVLP